MKNWIDNVREGCAARNITLGVKPQNWHGTDPGRGALFDRQTAGVYVTVTRALSQVSQINHQIDLSFFANMTQELICF